MEKEELKKSDEMLCTKEEFDKLLIDNIKYPYYVVNTEFGKYPWNIKEELNSAAVEGMVYAAKKYDPKRANECKFISYAVHWIRYYINEEIRKLYPVRFNQNFVSKRKKVTTFIAKYKKENNDEMPPISLIAKNVGMSEKVVKNILNVNGGENFTFLSFNMPIETEKSNTESESLNNDKLVNEYLENDAIDQNMMKKIEFDDLLKELKKEITPEEYDIFYDYYVNGENYSDLAKKYNLKFPSSAAYLIKKCEKRCKELLES